MRINGLVKAQEDPNIDGDDMEVLRQEAVKKWAPYCAHSKDKDLERMRVFCSKTKWCTVLVVELVDVAVQRSIVQSLVSCNPDLLDGSQALAKE